MLSKLADNLILAANVPGGGASFELLILTLDAPLPAAELPIRKSVLLVDDADAWSRFVEATLVDAGNTVTCSADGQADPAASEFVLVDDALETTDSLAVHASRAG
jgi:hypothetical protein